MTSIALKALTAASFVANIIVNYTDGKNISGWSAKYQTLITPAGYAFSIWGIIFTLEAIFCVAQFFPSFRSSPFLTTTTLASFLISQVLQCLWIILFSRQHIAASTGAMAGIWISLFILVAHQTCSLRRSVCRSQSCSARDGASMLHNPTDVTPGSNVPQTCLQSTLSFLFLCLPFLIHFAWITLAFVVSINLHVTWKYPDSVNCQFATAMVSLAVITLVVGKARGPSAIIIPAVVVWALVAVTKELSSPKDVITAKYSADNITAYRMAAKYVAIIAGMSALGHIIGGIACHGRRRIQSPVDNNGQAEKTVYVKW